MYRSLTRSVALCVGWFGVCFALEVTYHRSMYVLPPCFTSCCYVCRALCRRWPRLVSKTQSSNEPSSTSILIIHAKSLASNFINSERWKLIWWNEHFMVGPHALLVEVPLSAARVIGGCACVICRHIGRSGFPAILC
jgi:hypothetical protein